MDCIESSLSKNKFRHKKTRRYAGFFINSPKRKNGRGEANVFEPTQLRVKRIYRVQWKKAPINLDELAKLYWEEGLTVAQVAKALGVGRTTVRDYIARLGAPARHKGGLNGFRG